MEGGGVLSATDQQTMVSSFLEIAVGQTADTARQFLQVSIPSLFTSSYLLIDRLGYVHMYVFVFLHIFPQI